MRITNLTSKKFTEIIILSATLILAGTICFSAEKKKAAKEKPKPVEFKENIASGWMDKWPDGSLSGAKIGSLNGNAVVTGASSNNSYGSVYKNFSINLDELPYLTINVNSVDALWYSIAKSEKIKQGYVRIQTDIDSPGRYLYDLKSIMGLSGKQDFAIEMGVSTGKDMPNEGKKMSFNEFRFIAGHADVIQGVLRQSQWMDKWPDGKELGAAIRPSEEGLMVIGTSKKMSYGAVRKVISLNLDKTPFLKITAVSMTCPWYLDAVGGPLKEPVKIQFDSDSTKPQSYNLKNILGLSGEQSFELHIGVSAGEDIPNIGKEAIFKNLVFAAESGEKP